MLLAIFLESIISSIRKLTRWQPQLIDHILSARHWAMQLHLLYQFSKLHAEVHMSIIALQKWLRLRDIKQNIHDHSVPKGGVWTQTTSHAFLCQYFLVLPFFSHLIDLVDYSDFLLPWTILHYLAGFSPLSYSPLHLCWDLTPRLAHDRGTDTHNWVSDPNINSLMQFCTLFSMFSD